MCSYIVSFSLHQICQGDAVQVLIDPPPQLAPEGAGGAGVPLLAGGRPRLQAGHRGQVPLSVFCWGEPAQGITLEGLKYLLRGATLTCDVPRGVSNEFLGGPARITVEQGTLVVMVVA